MIDFRNGGNPVQIMILYPLCELFVETPEKDKASYQTL